MKYLFGILCHLASILWLQAQPTDSASQVKILLVPYQSMMYFSDADKDIARASACDEATLRASISNDLEIALYHKLLVHFEAVSLVRATSLNGEEDLRRIYAATSYTLHEGYKSKDKKKELTAVKKALQQMQKKTVNPFHVTDSSVMLAQFGSTEVFEYLHKKHQNQYVLFITQIELNTSNKNMIEWTRQEYDRAYTLHYNLFDHTGRMIRAETITLSGGKENNIKRINEQVLKPLAEKVVTIVEAALQ